MAKVTAEGVVTSVNGTGSGFRLEEGFEINGKWYRRFYTCWYGRGSTTLVQTGDKVKVTGTLSAKVAQDPRYVDLTINNAVLETIFRPAKTGETPPPPSDADAPPADDPWATTHQWEVAPIPDASAPF